MLEWSAESDCICGDVGACLAHMMKVLVGGGPGGAAAVEGLHHHDSDRGSIPGVGVGLDGCRPSPYPVWRRLLLS